MHFERVNVTPSGSILFTRDSTLDVSSGERNGWFVVSKYNSRYTRCTRHEAIRFTYRQMQHRDMLHLPFRYANRHDFIVRPSDCMPRVILPSVAPSASYFFFSCYLYTKPSRVVAGNDDGVGGGSRKSQINPFVIPHRSFQPVRIFTTSLLCHLRAPPWKLSPPFLFRLSLPSCQERFYNSTVSIYLFPV